jgi:hypothetical protein
VSAAHNSHTFLVIDEIDTLRSSAEQRKLKALIRKPLCRAHHDRIHRNASTLTLSN